jgi:hypothetical protein
MRPKESLAKAGNGSSDARDGQARSVGRQNGVSAEVRQNACEQRGLDFEILGDGFDHPITLGNPGQVVVEGAGHDQTAKRCLKECGRLRFRKRFKSGDGGRALRGLILWRKVKQERRDSGVGQMRGDARAHGSCAQHRGAAHQQRLRAHFRCDGYGRGGGAHAGSLLAA